MLKPMAWDWRKPDYAAAMRTRIENLRRIREYPEIVPKLMDHYRDHPADFIGDWGMMHEPRNVEIGLPAMIPFVLFPKQREFVDYVLDKWRNRRPGLVEKSRDVGATWLSISLSCTLCLLYDGLSIGFGSRKGEYVDKIGTLKPIFPKGRTFMENIPAEFRGDWVAWRDAPFMRITFPTTGSLIAGEGGDDIGRGDRTSIYFVDEAQPLSASILTPEGWATMADMAVGHEVIGRTGRTRVTHVNDCGVHDVFRITFSDGTYADASPNHLWQVEKVVGKHETLTLRTRELAENYSYESPGGQVLYRYRVPFCSPVQFRAQRDLPLDPYVLGALLGDGSTTGGVIRITSADPQVIEEVRRRLPENVIVGAFDGKYSYNLVDRRGRRGRGDRGEYLRGAMRVIIAGLGLTGCKAQDKFIPDVYKFASPIERLSVLQGLMDTDGYAADGRASFHTSSRRLAEDVRFLVQSLGGTTYWNIKPDARGYKTQYALQIVMPDGVPAFRLERKKAKSFRNRKAGGRTIVSIAPIGRMPVRCITVEAEDGLYLTDNFIVTHNSAHLARPEFVEASLSQTTNCRIDMSSVRGMANPFAQKRWGGKIEVFIFDWRDDPRKDQQWYDKQCQELDPVVVAQEIDRDYAASVRGVVIPGTWVRAAIDAKRRLGIAPSGSKALAFDVADEGEDRNAVAICQGTTVLQTEEWSGKGSDVFASTEYVFDLCDDHGLREFRYDADGIGADVRGDARVINERRARAKARAIRAVGYRGSESVVDPEGIVEGTVGLEGDAGRKNEDYFANHKAQAWWALRKRFQKTYRAIRHMETGGAEGSPCAPDDMISLDPNNPNLLKLTAELSQATYKQNDLGKLVIEKKPEGTKSPNQADAVVIRFAPMAPEPVEITGSILSQIARAGRMT